jgi:hypothetical protein
MPVTQGVIYRTANITTPVESITKKWEIFHTIP